MRTTKYVHSDFWDLLEKDGCTSTSKYRWLSQPPGGYHYYTNGLWSFWNRLDQVRTHQRWLHFAAWCIAIGSDCSIAWSTESNTVVWMLALAFLPMPVLSWIGGFDGILINTAVALADALVMMTKYLAMAINARRSAYWCISIPIFGLNTPHPQIDNKR